MEVDCLDDIKKSDDFENQKMLIIYFVYCYYFRH